MFCNRKGLFTGNGFTAAKSGSIIPEFAAPDNIFAEIDNGAEMYIITDSGDEVLIAVFKSMPDNKGRFIMLEDLE